MGNGSLHPNAPSTTQGRSGIAFRFWTPLTRQLTLFVLAAVVSVAIHARFKVSGWGEADAARLARDATGWHLQGYMSLEGGGYTQRTSAMYLRLEKSLLDHGLPVRELPRAMNWLSVLLGTACSLALFALFQQLTNTPVALAATLVHALTPGFWLGNIYGMPTVPGLCFFVLGVLAFLSASRAPRLRSGRFALLLGLSWLALLVALGFKADLALSTGAFLGVALLQPARRWPLVLAAAGVVGSAVAAVVIYGRMQASGPPGPGTVTFLKSWHEHFPFEFGALFTDSNNTTIVRCAGGLLFGVILLALLHGLVSGGALRRGALLAMLWGLPPILVWGFQFDDSARHNVPAFPPLILCATLFLFHIVGNRPRRAAVLIGCLVIVSYFSNTTGNGSIVPQSNLVALSEKLEAMTADLHARAKIVAQDTSLKRLVLHSSDDPYLPFEVLAAAKHPHLEMGEIWEMTDGPQVTRFFFGRSRSETRSVAREYQRQNFTVLSVSRY